MLAADDVSMSSHSQSRKILQNFWYALRRGAETVDKGLAVLAERPLKRLRYENRTRAMANREYAAIVKTQRANPQSGHNWSDLKTQFEVEDRVARHPFWEKPLRALSDHPLQRLWGHTHSAAQRVKRGWDDTSVWSLDGHLCRTLGEQLAHLADIMHGWPESDEFPQPEDWEAALRKNSAALLTYAHESGNHDNIPRLPNGEPDFEKWRAEQEKISAGARDALYWVADHLGALWD